MGRTIFIVGVAIAVCHPAIAVAQAAAGADEDASSEPAGEIVVTAQRREQRLTDVPLSVIATSGAELAKAVISDTRELPRIASGLTMQSNGPWLQPAIRGVTSQATIAGSEQNVATYLDGVYQPFAAANAFELPDVQRIEVLKGPQGTLFGRNAMGGAIQIITLDPTFTTTGKVTASYGRFHDTQLTGRISTPLTDTVALSVSAAHNHTGGWNRNLLDDGNRTGKVNSDIVRAKLLANVSDAAKFVLTGFYSKRSDAAVVPTVLLNGNGTARRLGITPLADRPFTSAHNYPSVIRTENFGFSLKGDVDVGAGTITSTTAYLNNRFKLLTDGDASTAQLLEFRLLEPIDTYSQEVIFASEKFGRFSFVAGAFGYYTKTGYIPGLFISQGGRVVQTQQFKVSATSYAGFAEGTFDLTDRLSLIGGARYTYEKRRVNNNYATNPDKRSASFNRVTPRASISYKVVDNANLYFTYSQGFKSGQYDTGTGQPNIVKPESLKSYEVGFKASQSMFNFTSSVFYLDYTNIQNQTTDPVFGRSVLENAGAAHIYGGDVALKVQMSPEFSVTAQGAYTHAKYTDYQKASITIPATNSAGVPIGGNVTVTRDLSGFRLARTPRLTGNLSVDYEKALTGGTLALSALLYYSGSYGIENGLRVKQPRYALLNTNASWTFGDSGVRVGIYGKNLTNREILLSAQFLPTGDAVSFQEPRSYGVNVSYSF